MQHWYDLDVRAWQDRGVDVSSLLDLTLFTQEKDLLMHGDRYCGSMSDSGGLPFTAPVTLESFLCDCWHFGATPDYADFADAVLALSNSDVCLERARSRGLTGSGFLFLLKGLSLLPIDAPAVSSPAAKVRTTLLQKFHDELGNRASYRMSVLKDYDLPSDIPDALMFVPQNVFEPFGIRLAASSPWVFERFAAAWVPDAPTDGYLFRAPEPVLSHLRDALSASGRYYCGVNASSIVVLHDDPDDVVDTALRLFDPDSPSLDTLEAVFVASRKLHA